MELIPSSWCNSECKDKKKEPRTPWNANFLKPACPDYDGYDTMAGY
jgi:hypothetical protein